MAHDQVVYPALHIMTPGARQIEVREEPADDTALLSAETPSAPPSDCPDARGDITSDHANATGQTPPPCEADGRVVVLAKIGKMVFYRLPPMSTAGLKSTLKMDVVIGLILSFTIIIAFSVVGSKQETLGMELSAFTKLAIAFAAMSASVCLVNCLLATLIFFSLPYDVPAIAYMSLAKFITTAFAVLCSSLTCLFSTISTDSEAGLSVLSFAAGVVSIPMYMGFFSVELYAILLRPIIALNQGKNPTLDEDFDLCCG